MLGLRRPARDRSAGRAYRCRRVDRFGMRESRKRFVKLDTERVLPGVFHRRFHRLEDVFFRDERHLDVELREFGLPVGALIFIRMQRAICM